MEKRKEPTPYHNLILATECLRDVGENRVSGALQTQIQTQLQTELRKKTLGAIGGLIGLAKRRVAAANALAQIGGQTFWTKPYGEPEWIQIPAGEFWMGEAKEQHRLFLDNYWISRVPITNAQYALFVEATDHFVPGHWEANRPPKGKESHPVVHVTWHDALAYCEWLSKVTGKRITLPSEAEWEKAARGDKDQRAYPWGETFEATRCNTTELGLNDTTPVGIFLEGASPYGVLDMSGNVWEWTRSFYKDYPYNARDGREDLTDKQEVRVLRGGSYSFNYVDLARCSVRRNGHPVNWYLNRGFRVVVSHSS